MNRSAESLFFHDYSCGAGVSLVVVAFAQLADGDAPARGGMGKPVVVEDDADVIDYLAFGTEKDEVARFKSVFWYRASQRRLFGCGAGELHLKGLSEEVHNQSGAVESLSCCSAVPVSDAEGVVDRYEKSVDEGA